MSTISSASSLSMDAFSKNHEHKVNLKNCTKKEKIHKLAKSSLGKTNSQYYSWPSLKVEKKIQTHSKFPILKPFESSGKKKLEEKQDPSMDIEPDLAESIRKFKEQTKGETLFPAQGVADVDSDVYFASEGIDLVIKPGLPDARGSLMAQEVLRVVGLNDTVPPMKLGKVQNLICSQDLAKDYVIKQNGKGKEFAIEAETFIPIAEGALPKNGTKVKDPRFNFSYIIHKKKMKMINLLQ